MLSLKRNTLKFKVWMSVLHYRRFILSHVQDITVIVLHKSRRSAFSPVLFYSKKMRAIYLLSVFYTNLRTTSVISVSNRCFPVALSR